MGSSLSATAGQPESVRIMRTGGPTGSQMGACAPSYSETANPVATLQNSESFRTLLLILVFFSWLRELNV